LGAEREKHDAHDQASDRLCPVGVCRALARVLHELSLENFAPPTRFQQIIMAAPDIDAATLRELASAIRCTAERVTLYASASDKALITSRRFHRYPRAGEFVFPIAGIDVIDASAVDTSLIGHSYYGDNRSIIADMFGLLMNGDPPENRFDMSQFVREDGSYFAFLPWDSGASELRPPCIIWEHNPFHLEVHHATFACGAL
jgi:hypothetical protein